MNLHHNKNILLISPETGFGGSEKSFASLTVDLSRHYNIYTAFFSTIENPVYPIGGETINLNTIPAKNLFWSVKNLIIRYKKIKSIKKEKNIHISISFLEGANYLNVLTRKNENCIISIRGSLINDTNIKGILGFIRIKILIPFLYKKADRIVCISNGLKNEMIRSFNLNADKIHVIYNMINVKEIRQKSLESIEPKFQKLFKNHSLINHSRISPEKGLQFQLLILKSLLKKLPNIKLFIVGKGPFKKELIKVCQSLDLTYYEREMMNDNPDYYNVIFWGYTKNPFNLLEKATLFISTSLAEGLGNSILEAMACKCMVISTDCPYGPREIILPEFGVIENKSFSYPLYDKNGILMPIIKDKNDKAAIDLWANTIEKVLLDDYTMPSVDSAFNRAIQFDSKKNINAWLTLLK